MKFGYCIEMLNKVLGYDVRFFFGVIEWLRVVVFIDDLFGGFEEMVWIGYIIDEGVRCFF